LFTASEDGAVAVWDLRAAVPRFTWALSRYGGNNVAVSPDGRLAAAPSFGDKSLRVWNLSSGELALPPLFAEGGVWEVNFSADGTKLLASGTSAQVWEVATGKPRSVPLSLPPTETRFLALPAFSRDGQRVVSSSGKTNDVRVWNAATGELIAGLNTDSPVGRAEFSADGEQVVAASTNGTVFVWNLPASEPALRFSADDAVRVVRFSADGQRIATAGGKHARVWDARSGQPVTPPLRNAGGVFRAEFSPDGRWLVTTAIEGVRAWNTTNGQPFAPLLHRGIVRAAAFSENGKLLAAASADKTVRVWDVATGDPLTPPLAHPSEVNVAKFTPDGRWLLTASSGGSESSLRVWELPKDNRSVADWTQLAQFFAGSREAFEVPASAGHVSEESNQSGRLSAMSAEAGTPNNARTNALSFPETWLALRQKHPSAFSITESELDAWERHAAARAEGRSDWPAAIQHLTRLLQARPDSGEFLPRRARAFSRWAGAAGTPAASEHLQSALADYTRAIASVELHRDIARQSRKPLLVERSKVLRQLHRPQEAQADLLEAKDIPPRPAGAGPHLIDLTPWYNAGFNESLLTLNEAGGDFSVLAPAGVRKLATGVEFDLRGLILLGSQMSFPPDEFPESVTGIKVARPTRRLHFLHATGTSREVAGTPVAKIVLHLANGQTQTLDLKLGGDLWNYTFESGQAKLTKNSRVAWTGPANPRHPDGPQAQLFQTTWENPSPDTVVDSIDYISAMNDPVPFLIAITTEP
jgi:WD40 repeat protein